jgi:3-methyladenine DNA glycosylase AlkD
MRNSRRMTAAEIEAVLIDLNKQIGQLVRRDTPSHRRVRRALSKKLQNAAPSTVIRLADALVRRGKAADRLIAFEIVASHPLAFAALNEAKLLRWSRVVSSWDSVDLFGCTLGGQAWRAGIISDATVAAWTRSQDRWRRRLALVCTVPLNSRARGGQGDATRTLRICESLVNDRDDMVVKALSWALRELAKRESAVVRSFLDRHDDRLAGRVKREVANKLKTGKKDPNRGKR